jgi:hypothetical protein
MSINARSIATLGIGFGVKAIASIGFLSDAVVSYARGGTRTKRKLPEWLNKLLSDLEGEWATDFVATLSSKAIPLEKLKIVETEIVYLDLDIRQIQLALVLIEKIKLKKIKQRQEEELLLFM